MNTSSGASIVLKPAARFDRRFWLTLVFAVLIILGGLALLLRRYVLPTDGWANNETVAQEVEGLIYETNLMGVASGLQTGDVVVAVEGQAFRSMEDLSLPPGVWQAGNTLSYTVMRQGQLLKIDVPLVNWRPGPLWRSALRNPSGVISLLGQMLFLAVALLAFVKRPENRAAGALFWLAAVNFAATVASDYLFGLPDQIDPALSIGSAIIVIGLFTIWYPPALLRLALLFPRPKPALVRWPWLEHVPLAIGVLILPLMLVTNGVAAWYWTAASLVGTVLLMLHNALTMRDAASQAQLRWSLGGLILGLGMFAAGYPAIFQWVQGPWTVVLTAADSLGSAVVGIFVSIAILRYRLFDIDLIIRRTLVYSLLTALLALVYFGGVAILQGLFGALGRQQSAIAVVASTLAIAALFAPLRRRVQEFIDRRFFRRKYDAAQTLAEFAATARDETDLDRLTGRLESVVQETMQPRHVSLWLNPTAVIDPSWATVFPAAGNPPPARRPRSHHVG